MKSNPPNFAELNRIEEELIVAKLQAVRMAISHAGEKGRALEHGVTSLLREILPAEYGLSTGFVVYHAEAGPRLSPQLDIIIYDALRGGPIVRLETCDVLPLESVYGCVEVKASIVSSTDRASKPAESSVERCLELNCQLRKMQRRNYWAPDQTNPVGARFLPKDWMAIRSYVFAFEATGSAADIASLAQRMADYSRMLGHPTHLHGCFVASTGFLYTRPINRHKSPPDPEHVVMYAADHGLLEFKTRLLVDLARYPRYPEGWAPALDRYFESGATWLHKLPAAAEQTADH